MLLFNQFEVFKDIFNRRIVLSENIANKTKGYKKNSCQPLECIRQYKKPTVFAVVGDKEPKC